MTIKNVSWWHEQLADWMLLNPNQPLKAAASVFGVSVNYIYMVKNSDSFKEYWARRRASRESHMNETHEEILGSLHEKVSSVADMALDQILEQLEDNAKAQSVGAPMLDHHELRTTADMALKKLGYGIPTPPAAGGAAQINSVNVVIDSDLLAKAREKMKLVHGVEPARPLAVEAQPEEIKEKDAIDS